MSPLLRNRLAKLEQALRNKDELLGAEVPAAHALYIAACKAFIILRNRSRLAENLHVIDFEQLKIENQQLNAGGLTWHDIAPRSNPMTLGLQCRRK